MSPLEGYLVNTTSQTINRTLKPDEPCLSGLALGAPLQPCNDDLSACRESGEKLKRATCFRSMKVPVAIPTIHVSGLLHVGGLLVVVGVWLSFPIQRLHVAVYGAYLRMQGVTISLLSFCRKATWSRRAYFRRDTRI